MIGGMLSFDEVLRALRSIDTKIMLEPDRVLILEHIASLAMDIFKADSCRIHRYDPVTKTFQSEASVGLGAQWRHLPRPKGMGAQVIETSHFAWENDSAKLNPVVRKAGITNTGAFPLHPAGSEPVGVLYLHFKHRPGFSEEEVNLVFHFAFHAGLAIQLAELREVDKRHIEDLEALRRAMIEVAGARTLRDSLQQVAHLACEVVHADAAIMYPWDARKQTLNRTLIVGAGLDMDGFQVAEPRPGGLTRTLMSRGVISVEDVSSLDPTTSQLVRNMREHIMVVNRLRSFIGIALSAGDETVGVLYVFFEASHRSGVEEINTLSIFAEGAATRIQLAKLSEVQRKAAVAEAVAALGAAAAQFAHKMANVAGTVPMVINDISNRLEKAGISDRAISRRLDDLREDTMGLINMADQLRLRDIGATRSVNLCRVVEEAVRAAHLGSQTHIHLSMGGDTCIVNAVKVDLREIIVNLFQNAEQAGAKNIDVTLSRRPEAEMVDLHVRDDGSGIRKEDVEKVFMPLYTTKDRSDGTHGIGLWASQYQIERMGGEISVESEFGAGTCITLSLRMP